MFTGEGGTFRNDVKFKVIGDPFIKFEKIGKYSGTSIVEMISGDGLEYDVYFKPMDFISICSEPRKSMICLSVKRRGMSTTIMMSCTLEKTDE